MTTIKYLARDEKTEIEIRVEREGNSVSVTNFVNGKLDWSANELTVAVNPAIPGVVATIGHIGLFQDRADQVQAAINAIQAQIDADPVAKLQKLIQQRNTLSRSVAYILDAAHETHLRFIEGTSANGFAKSSSRDFGTEEQAARDALATFDAAHPDVLVAIKAAKTEATQRFLDAN